MSARHKIHKHVYEDVLSKVVVRAPVTSAAGAALEDAVADVASIALFDAINAKIHRLRLTRRERA